MRNSKNQLANAELKFSYAHYPELLMLNCTFKARDLLLKLWKEECQCIEPKRYVLFLNEKKQFITWKCLPVKVGYHRLTTSKPNRSDKDLITKTIESCKHIGVDILDYLIVTKEEGISYRLWLTL